MNKTLLLAFYLLGLPELAAVLGDADIWKGSGEEIEFSFHMIPQYPISVLMQFW